MAMKTNNDGSDDDDRDDRDNCDDDDNNDAVDGNNDSDNIEHINEDNGYKCARLHIHARALAHPHAGTFARLHTLIDIGFYI